MDVDIIGVNCSEGPEGLLPVVVELCKYSSLPIMVQPNAGLPEMVDGKTVYKQSAKEFADYIEKFQKMGVNALGGCCGTTPDHIKEIATRLEGKKPIKRNIKRKTKLSSRLKTVTIEGKTLIIGERINPTGKPDFQDELKHGKTNYIREAALEQASDGAALLDINVGVAGVDETITLPKAVETVDSLIDAPVVIDSSNPIAMELALKKYSGKPLINSVNGSEKSLKEILPLAKKYGAAIIALTLDHDGIPKTKEKRIEIAKKIIDEAKKIGIKSEDIIVDCLVMTLATNPENEQIILDSVKEIKALGYKTILGVSNISHGLPNRSEINSKFLTKASKAGLDLAILNPKDNIVQDNTDIEVFRAKKIDKESYADMSIEKKLEHAILYGDKDNILNLIEEGLKTLTDPKDQAYV